MSEPTFARFWARTCFGLEFALDSPWPTPSLCESGSTACVRVALSTSISGGFEKGNWRTIYRSREVGPQGTPALIIEDLPADLWIRIRYDDGTTFVLDRDGSTVRGSWASDATLEDAESYLVGPVFGLLLYLRGLTCLHASAIARHGEALVFVGAAEAGKSTLAAAFAKNDHPVLSDDILVLERAEDVFFARPGVPRIGLWPESVQHLWGDRDALPRQVATWDKRFLDLDRANLFQETPLPIGALYVLGDRMPGVTPRIECLQGVEAVLALIANKYVTRVAKREQDTRDFELLSAFAASVPIRRITRSDALSDLDATRDAILADHDSLVLERT